MPLLSARWPAGLQTAAARLRVSAELRSFGLLQSDKYKTTFRMASSEATQEGNDAPLFAPVAQRPAQQVVVDDSEASAVLAGKPKLTGWDWYHSIGCPKYFVAPMVQQSELAFRLLTREYGAQVTVTPMIHARIFLSSPKFRRSFFDYWPEDNPLIAQFCGNDPQTVVNACKLVQHRCCAVDLNLGCPQNIAKRGNYGSFLLEDADTVVSIVKACAEQLSVPITCKIRLQENFDVTLQLIKRLEAAGASLITVHGRTRHENKLANKAAHWDKIARIKQHASIPIIANGGMFDLADIRRCMSETGVDGVMLSEAVLDNPSVFSSGVHLPTGQQHNVIDMAWRYLEIAEAVGASWQQIQGHLVKMLYGGLAMQRDLQDRLCKGNGYFTFDRLKGIVIELGKRYGMQVRPFPVQQREGAADSAHGDRILWWTRFHAHNLELKKHQVSKRSRQSRAELSRAVDLAAAEAEKQCLTEAGLVQVPILPALAPMDALDPQYALHASGSVGCLLTPAGMLAPLQAEACPPHLLRELTARSSGNTEAFAAELASRKVQLAFPHPGLWYFRHAPRIVAAALAPCASLALALTELAEARSAQHHTHVLRDVEALKVYLQAKHGSRLQAAHAAGSPLPKDIALDALALPIMSCEEAEILAKQSASIPAIGCHAGCGGDAVDQLSRDMLAGDEHPSVGIAAVMFGGDEDEDAFAD